LEPHYLLESTRAIPIFNIALAATLFVITAVPFAYLLYRVRKVLAAGLVYSTRRRVTTEHRAAVCVLTLLLQVRRQSPYTRCPELLADSRAE
jgi:hypothetical protein